MAVAVAVHLRAALTDVVAELAAGDVVVTMSYPGLFTLVEIRGDEATIASVDGQHKTVRLANLRRVQRPGDATT